jgi:hypothetical protein
MSPFGSRKEPKKVEKINYNIYRTKLNINSSFSCFPNSLELFKIWNLELSFMSLGTVLLQD